MKTEDFDRLKQICDENGFEFHVTDRGGEQVSIIIQKKDPWEGIEFVECKWSTLIYRVQDVELGKDFKPSTEQAYIEQLKKQAFERFGEIKEGNRFDLSKIDFDWDKDYKVKGNDFEYRKDRDALMVGNNIFKGTIYQQGKWATRIKPFKAVYCDWNYADNGMEVNLTFKISNWDKAKDKDDIGEYIAEQLNKYLNEKRD